MIFHVKLSIYCIFATTKKVLDIFKMSLIQMKAMDHIYHFYKPEVVIIEVSQRSSKCEQVSHIAYINVRDLHEPYLTVSHSVRHPPHFGNHKPVTVVIQIPPSVCH